MSYATEFVNRASFHELDTARLHRLLDEDTKTITFTITATHMNIDTPKACYTLVNERGLRADVILIDIVCPEWRVERWVYRGRHRGYKVFLTIVNQ